MAMIRPNLTLVFDLDERTAQHETVLELKRAYAHITAPIIRTHAGNADEPASNTARLMVSMGTYTYWNSADEGADERWASIMEPWVKNVFRRVGNNMKAFNKRQREINLPEVHFDYATLEFAAGNFVIGVHPQATGYIDPDLCESVDTIRTLVNSGVFADASRVDVPALASYLEQHEAEWATWVIEHPEPEVAEEEPVEEEPVEPEPEKTREQLLQEDIEAKSYERTAVPPTDSNTLPKPFREEEEEEDPFDFTVDYNLWQVFFADGSSKLFNAAAQVFVTE